jgi:3'-phosphoadenosine 5'-phosphosulfate sulfotransferase (PAPS reductase)/FAD synthetase/ferredoxin
MWACNKQYFYQGVLLFEVKGANIYDPATVILAKGIQPQELRPTDVAEMLRRNKDFLFLIESEAIEFIRDTYLQYTLANRSTEQIAANQIDYNTLLEKAEKRTKKQMAIVKEGCDSFDIVAMENAKSEGKRIYHTTRIDRFLASFSGGKDSQVVLDLCTRAIPSTDFEVVYSDTGYELPTSLSLYWQTQQHYTSLYPDLKFSVARNHETVLNYWDQIGIPSDTHRWCCSVMKTAPLYRMFKVEGTNKQAKVLAYEGTRSEESMRRSKYNRIGKGVKHNVVINARPILEWNTTEIFLYLLKYNLPINLAYRMGKPRVGCLICPFSSEWDDMIMSRMFPKNLQPFLSRIEDWANSRNIPNKDEYIKGHKWKLRASGKFIKSSSTVLFKQDKNNLIAKVTEAKQDFFVWISTLGKTNISKKEDFVVGELKYKDNIYKFDITYHDSAKQNYTVHFYSISDLTFIGLLKRVLYKTTHCIQCEACEVECPTGALSVYPTVKVDNTKCIHCCKCLNFHNKGCVVADSLSMTQNYNEKLTGISAYGTFGFRDEWLNEFFINHEDFRTNNSLGKKQIPSFKSWLRDSEIIDNRGNITPLGELLAQMYQNMPDIVWEIIWINLTYNSPLIKWFVNNIKVGTIYSKKLLLSIYEEQYSEGYTTFKYSLDALYNTLTSSPIGVNFHQKEELSKSDDIRKSHNDISDAAVAYSLYKYGKTHFIKSFRLDDIYNSSDGTGILFEFGIDKVGLEKTLRTLDTLTPRVLTAELNMGLDNITLHDNMDVITVLKQLAE